MTKHIIVTLNIPKDDGDFNRKSGIINLNTTVFQDLFDWAKESGIVSPTINDFTFSEIDWRWESSYD